jgi:predicted RNA-binding Zn-ribbon protein involved in translation (DUF1610 family)
MSTMGHGPGSESSGAAGSVVNFVDEIDANGNVKGDSTQGCVQCRYPLRGLPASGACPECGTAIEGSLGARSEVDQSGQVKQTSTRLCIRCGYALRGLPAVGKCPECGTAVEESLKERRLYNSSKEYITTVRGGLSLVLNGILLAIGLGFLAVGLAFVIGPSIGWVAAFGSAGIVVMIAVGFLRFAQPDPAEAITQTTLNARKYLRISVIAWLVCSLLGSFAEIVPLVGFTNDLNTTVWVLSLLVQILGFIASVVQFVCMMRYTRWMASRVPDA